MPCDTYFLGHVARRYRWQQSFDPMASLSLTFGCRAGQGKVKARSNIQINIFTQKAHVSCSDFPQDSKYVISFLVRCGELQKIASKKMVSSVSRYILQIPFFMRNIGFVCSNFSLIMSNHKVALCPIKSNPLSHQE